MKNKQKPLVSILLPWDVYGAAGIEQQWMLIIKHLDPKAFQIHLMIHTRFPIDFQKIRSCFPNWVQIETFSTEHTRRLIFTFAFRLYKQKPQLIFASTPHLGCICVLAKWLARSKTKLISMNQGIDLSHCFTRWQLSFSSKFSNIYLAVSEGIKESMIKKNNISSKKILVIPNSFDLKEIQKQADEPLPPFFSWQDNKKKIVYLGRLEEQQKNILLLLSAFEVLNKSYDNLALF